MRPLIMHSIVPLCLLVAAAPLAAQEIAPLGSVAALAPVAAQRPGRAYQTAPADTDTTSRGAANDGARSDTTGRLRTEYAASERFAMRSIMGAVGWFGGAYVGAHAGSKLAKRGCRSFCTDAEDAAWTGLFVGGIVGTTLVVSAMGFGDRCNVATRATLALLGASLGSLAGTFAGFSGAGGGHPFLVMSIGGGMGGAGGAALCTAEGPVRRKR